MAINTVECNMVNQFSATCRARRMSFIIILFLAFTCMYRTWNPTEPNISNRYNAAYDYVPKSHEPSGEDLLRLKRMEISLQHNICEKGKPPFQISELRKLLPSFLSVYGMRPKEKNPAGEKIFLSFHFVF